MEQETAFVAERISELTSKWNSRVVRDDLRKGIVGDDTSYISAVGAYLVLLKHFPTVEAPMPSNLLGKEALQIATQFLPQDIIKSQQPAALNNATFLKYLNDLLPPSVTPVMTEDQCGIYLDVSSGAEEAE